MKVLTTLFLVYLLNNVETKLYSSIGYSSSSNNFLETVHSVVDVIRKSGSRPLVTVVLQENSLHPSNELFRQVHLVEYFPTLALKMQEKITLNLKEMFSDDVLFSGLIGVPRILFWFVEKFDQIFWEFLAQFRDTFIGNPRIPFIIITTLQDQNEIYLLKEECKILWKEYHILNIVVINFVVDYLPNHKNTNQSPLQITPTEVWFYNQFKNKGSFREVSKTLLRNSGNNIFSDKLNDIYGHKIKVTRGRGVSILKLGQARFGYFGMQLLVRGMNATMVTIRPKHQDMVGYPDDETNLDTKENIPDLFGNIYFKHTKNQFTSTASIYQNCIQITVPKALRVPQYLNIFLPFSKNTWALVLGTLPFITLLWKLFRQDASLEILTILETFRIFVTGATNFTSNSSRQKIFVMSCLWVSLILLGAYQGSLISYLTVPHFYPDINTLDQLIDTNLNIAILKVDGTGDDLKVMFKDMDFNDKVVASFIERAFFVNSVKTALDMVAFNRTIAYADGSFYSQIYIQENRYYKDGYPLLHLMKECPLSLRLAIQFPYVSPLQDRIEKLVRRIVESGLLLKCLNDDLYELSISAINRVRDDQLKALGLSHTQTAFYILLVGITISFSSFVFEILFRKIIFKRNHI